MELVKSDLGLVTLCGYAVNDILAWVILAVVLGIATPAGVSLVGAAFALVFAVAFTTFCLTWGMRLVDGAFAFVSRELPDQPGIVLTLVTCVGLAGGALTHAAGLTALFGFFLAGVMSGESQSLSERTRHVVSQMVHAVFVPLYFAGIGLRYDFLVEFDWFIVAFVTFVSIAAKFAGAWLGAVGTHLSKEDRLSIGIAFTPSGVTGIVVADVALAAGILSTEVFVGIVVSAIVSSLLVAPWLSWSIRRRKPVDLRDYLQRDTVRESLEGRTRYEVIDEICAGITLLSVGGLSGAKCAAAVRACEDLVGTGVGHSVAFPHARLPALDRTILAFGRSHVGIDWDAPDGLPVHLVFLLLSPEREYGRQLQVLAGLSRVFSDPSASERLLTASEGDVWSELEDLLRERGRVSPS